MKLNEEGIKLMHEYEGLELNAYECPTSLSLPKEKKFWTIGYGNTFYEDGSKVKKGDKITLESAEMLFKNIVEQKFEKPIKKLIKKEINDNKYSAIVSFAYNVGIGNLSNSTLLKMVNQDPNNPFIREQFLRWNKANGKPLYGLTRRRTAEANLYFKK